MEKLIQSNSDAYRLLVNELKIINIVYQGNKAVIIFIIIVIRIKIRNYSNN